jgi:hypothetical protein
VRSASGDAAVCVRSADPGRLAELLTAQGAHVEDDGDALSVSGTTSEQIGPLALAGGIALSELSRGGLGFGYGPVSLVLAVLIVGFVAYLASSRIDVARVETAGE